MISLSLHRFDIEWSWNIDLNVTDILDTCTTKGIIRYTFQLNRNGISYDRSMIIARILLLPIMDTDLIRLLEMLIVGTFTIVSSKLFPKVTRRFTQTHFLTSDLLLKWYKFRLSPKGMGKSHRIATVNINSIIYTFIEQNQIGFYFFWFLACHAIVL